FGWSLHGAHKNKLTFISNHPNNTDRDLTVAELEYLREVSLPERLLLLAEYRGALTEFTKLSAENHRIGETELFGVENSYKALRGRLQALLEPKLWQEKIAKERALRAAVAKDPDKEKAFGGAWEAIARAEAE